MGHCFVPPVGQRYSLLSLSNSTAVARAPLSAAVERARQLLRRRAHLHHYNAVAGFSEDSSNSTTGTLRSAIDNVSKLISAYEFFDNPDALAADESELAFKIAD